MAESNQVKINWQQMTNNKVIAEGYFAEYTARDWYEFSRKKIDNTSSGQINTSSENLFYSDKIQQILLRPNIEPIDMIVEDFNAPYNGDWWNAYGTYANWEVRKIMGSPECLMLYQKNVQYKDINNNYQVVDWSIFAGSDYGFKLDGFKENQGFIIWIANNILPDNVQNELVFHLYHLNPHNQEEVVNGVYIKITASKEFQICHYIDIEDTGLIPPRKKVFTQWEQGSLTPQKKFVEWPGNPVFYVLMMSDKYILFGVNGLDNPFTMECQDYETGKTMDGLNYPVLVREDANLFISGKGQVLLGFKKLAYKNKATITLPEFKPGYVLNSPQYQVLRVKRNNDDEVDCKFYKHGITKSDYKVYGEITLSGQEMPTNTKALINYDESAKNRIIDYRNNNTETTPSFIKVKIVDNQAREKGTDLTLPGNIESEIISFTETSNSNNGIANNITATVECYGSFEKLYATNLTNKKLLGNITIRLKENLTDSNRYNFIFQEPQISISGFENIKLTFNSIENDILHYLNQKTGYIISFDDMNIADIQAMETICDILKIDFETDVEGQTIPDNIENKEGTYTFQPNVTFLEILAKLAEIQGHLLYPYQGKLCYKKIKSTTDFIIGRAKNSLTENITYTQLKNYKSRLIVVGTAGENTEEYKIGQKLVGIWRNSTLEQEIGYTPHVCINDALTNWEMVEQYGNKLWNKFNSANYKIVFTIPYAKDYVDKIFLFNVFQWFDPSFSAVHDKRFLITDYSITVDMANCEATITGEMIV